MLDGALVGGGAQGLMTTARVVRGTILTYNPGRVIHKLTDTSGDEYVLPCGRERSSGTRLEDGTALAALSADHDTAAALGVTGSPTFVLGEGRQKLFGNVGYRILEAKVEELLRNDRDSASWC